MHSRFPRQFDDILPNTDYVTLARLKRIQSKQLGKIDSLKDKKIRSLDRKNKLIKIEQKVKHIFFNFLPNKSAKRGKNYNEKLSLICI
ncbi:hypothetical protein B6D60_03955 [candidate division KSB1 bacterium 4484_87]|nr:MAG: hypothetical protein B6D60_03955 [candidate division KSB1 bacterium 4484_87]